MTKTSSFVNNLPISKTQFQAYAKLVLNLLVLSRISFAARIHQNLTS